MKYHERFRPLDGESISKRKWDVITSSLAEFPSPRRGINF